MCEKQDNAVSGPRRVGFTLTEILIVVAILALLVTMMVVGAGFIQTRNKTVLTQKSLDIISTAIAEFRDITGHFPVDDWSVIDTETGCRIAGADNGGPTEPEPEPNELLYLQLSILPQTREIIANLPERLLAGSEAEVVLAGQTSPTRYLRSIVDGWEVALRYERNGPDFPSIWSCGPDGMSDSLDPDTLLDDISK